MKLKLTTLLVVSFSIALAQNTAAIKRLYYNAIENEDSTELLVEITEQVNNNSSAILMGYKGMGLMLSAKYAWLPTSKLSYFSDGKKWLENAIKKSPNNIELLFFRFTTQMETPEILGYKDNLAQDRVDIIALYPKLQDPFLRKIIRQYMINKVDLSPDQIKVFT